LWCLKDAHALPFLFREYVSPDTRKRTDLSSGFAKAFPGLLADEIRLKGNALKIRGSYQRLAPNSTGLLHAPVQPATPRAMYQRRDG
jgi:hypothetical protein